MLKSKPKFMNVNLLITIFIYNKHFYIKTLNLAFSLCRTKTFLKLNGHGLQISPLIPVSSSIVTRFVTI